MRHQFQIGLIQVTNYHLFVVNYQMFKKIEVNKNYEDAMHMTSVRWHILFSHCSVLPIKPWMSLSLSGDTSTFHISPSNQSNPWCVCIKAPSASNASLHPSSLCIKGGGRKAQLHFFRGRAFGLCVGGGWGGVGRDPLSHPYIRWMGSQAADW